MAIKDHIKWILTRSHFWIVLAFWAAWDIYTNYDLYGGNKFVIIGSIFGTFIFVFVIYSILRTIRVFVSRRKKE